MQEKKKKKRILKAKKNADEKRYHLSRAFIKDVSFSLVLVYSLSFSLTEK